MKAIIQINNGRGGAAKLEGVPLKNPDGTVPLEDAYFFPPEECKKIRSREVIEAIKWNICLRLFVFSGIPLDFMEGGWSLSLAEGYLQRGEFWHQDNMGGHFKLGLLCRKNPRPIPTLFCSNSAMRRLSEEFRRKRKLNPGDDYDFRQWADRESTPDDFQASLRKLDKKRIYTHEHKPGTLVLWNNAEFWHARPPATPEQIQQALRSEPLKRFVI